MNVIVKTQVTGRISNKKKFLSLGVSVLCVLLLFFLAIVSSFVALGSHHNHRVTVYHKTKTLDTRP